MCYLYRGFIIAGFKNAVSYYRSFILSSIHIVHCFERIKIVKTFSSRALQSDYSCYNRFAVQGIETFASVRKSLMDSLNLSRRFRNLNLSYGSS